LQAKNAFQATLGRVSPLSADESDFVDNVRRSSKVKTTFDLLSPIYPDSEVERFYVSADKIAWSVNWPDYKPNRHTSKSILLNPEADVDLLI
jgi:hypothetical protein